MRVAWNTEQARISASHDRHAALQGHHRQSTSVAQSAQLVYVVRKPAEARHYFLKKSRPVLQPPPGLQWVLGSSLPEVKWPRRTGDQWPPSTAEVRMRCGVPPFPSQALHGAHRDSFTFCPVSNVTGLPCSAAKLTVKHFLQNDEAWATKNKQMPDTRYFLPAHTQTKWDCHVR